MEINRIVPFIGILGAVLALGGLIAYSMAPDKLWLVTLCEGLALICLTGFFIIHFETVKAFSARRSTRFGLNSVLMVLLFMGIIVILNFLAARHSQRWDLSEAQNFTLAPQTYEVLRGLSREVKVTVFTQFGSQAFNTYRDLLDSYRQGSRFFKVEYVDPERSPAIARQYGITRKDTAVFESGSQTTRVAAPSEAELTSALIRTSKDSKKRVVFLEGHGERDITSQEREGYSLVEDALRDQGYEVETLTLLQESQVPEHTSVLVIAGPQRLVTKEEQDRIAAYLAQGGRLLIMLDPKKTTGMEPLLGRWGVEVGEGTLIDLQDKLAQGDLTALMVRTFTEHEITQDFRLPVLFPVSRHVAFRDEVAKDWNFVPLARTSPRSWAETDLTDGRVVTFNTGKDIQGPLPLAGALTPKQDPEEGEQGAALVVVGNSSFASNVYINFPGNRDFFLHTIGWLAEERTLISITPKDPAFRPFFPNPTQARLLLYVQVLFLPAVTFLWGVTVWRKRRRL